MIVPFDDLELSVYQSLRTLEPPKSRKFPRVNAHGTPNGEPYNLGGRRFLRPARAARRSTMPAKYVRPYSKGQKNDFRDAEAIAEAVQRPTMRFGRHQDRRSARLTGPSPRGETRPRL